MPKPGWPSQGTHLPVEDGLTLADDVAVDVELADLEGVMEALAEAEPETLPVLEALPLEAALPVLEALPLEATLPVLEALPLEATLPVLEALPLEAALPVETIDEVEAGAEWVCTVVYVVPLAVSVQSVV